MRETIITSSVLIIIIITLRYLLRGRISSRLQYSLWALVAIRLLLPFSLFESPFSVMNVMPDLQPTYKVSTESARTVYKGNTVLFSNDSPALSNSQEVSSRTISSANTINWEQIARGVWLCGLLLSGAFFATSNMRLSQKLKRNRKLIEVRQCPLPIYVADGLPSPCLYGIRKPVVYITPESLSDSKRTEYVVAHELTHYRQKDHIWSFIRLLCLCIHWFNPLVWIAVVLSRRDSELACDERTLRRIGYENRMEYGRTLIEMMASSSKPSDLFCCATTMTGSKGEMTERIKRIAKQPKTLIITIAVVVVVAFAGGALTFGSAARKVPVALPDDSTVTGIKIEEMNEGESLGIIRITQKSDMEVILAALADTNKTFRQSINDAPNYDNYYKIKVESPNTQIFYLYRDKGKYYLEQPYTGIYRTDHKTSAVIAKFYDPKGSGNNSIYSQELWGARIPNLPDKSTVSKLLDLLQLPEGLRQNHFTLHTSGNERRIEWILQGDNTASYEGSSLYLNTLVLFALVDNLQDFNVTMMNHNQEEAAFHYDRTWADETVGCDVHEYGKSPEKLQELLDTYEGDNAFAQYNIAKIGKKGEVLTDYFRPSQELALAIMNDCMSKSASFEGVDITTIKECYLLQQIFPESLETYDYYAYLQKNGTAVLQSGKKGRYQVLSIELYTELVNSFKTLSKDPWSENKYTKGVPRPDFDNMIWMTPDNENKYCVALYQNVSKAQIKEYLKTLKKEGWQTIRDLYKNTSLGGRYQNTSHTISIQFNGEDELVLYFSLIED